MSSLANYIAQQRLNLQQESNSLARQKMSLQQSNFERQMQANYDNEVRRSETSLEVAKIQAQNNLDITIVGNMMSGTNQFFAFLQNEIGRQNAHNMEMERLDFEHRSNRILEVLRNKNRLDEIKLQAEIEIQRMLKTNEINKDYLTYSKFCDIYFRLIEREVGLDMMAQNMANIEASAQHLFEQVNQNKDYSPYG